MSSERESYVCSQSGSGADKEHKLRIRKQNDGLRQTMAGGQVLITQGVEALGLIAVTSILEAVRRFDGFPAANDPHGNHDFGSLSCAGQKILWKIDYYDSDLIHGSPDPSDPAVTTRVLTIMLASEY